MIGGDGLMFTFDMREVNRMAAKLGRADAAVVAPLALVVAETATATRDILREDATGHPKARHFPRSITHDVRGLTAEIGPDKGRTQGALGNLLYFGSVNNAPVLPPPTSALERVRPLFEAGIAEAATAGLAKGLE
jgi:hypothetical protein